MLEVGAFEAKNTLGSLLNRVESGEEVLITRHGRPVARLVPNSGRLDRTEARAAATRIRARAAHSGAAHSGSKVFDWESLKRDRDAGRP
jgi:prevent-host-death family protein